MKKPSSGGGWQALRYTWRKGREVGPTRLWRAMSSKNACKTCALGMGGQLGGMRNEAGHFPEVCKKSLQAMAADMQGSIRSEFWSKTSIEQLKSLSPRELEHMGRLTEPVLAGPGESHYRPVSWEEALEHIASGLRSTEAQRAFFYASGRSSIEAGFLLNLFARSFGTNHVSNCSFYCHQASGHGLKESIGLATATVTLEDLELSDLVVLIGGNPSSNHPRLMATLMRLRERGGKVVVVNPLKETGLVNFRVPSSLRSMLMGSPIASLYVQPRIGGDIALMAGVMKRLIETDQLDHGFIGALTEGFSSVRDLVTGLSWEDIEVGSGLERTSVGQVADALARSSRTVFAWTMGVTHHLHGVENVQWITNLALVRGMVGKPGAGLLPIRGHSNVQGMGSIGVTPEMSKAAVERLSEMGVHAPSHKGHDTLACLEGSLRGEFDFALCLGGNLFGASPDAGFARDALSRLKNLVYLSTTLNTGHAHGLGQTTLILPVLARDEEPQSTTQESMFSFVRLSEGGHARHEGPKSESEVLAKLGQRTLSGVVDWRALENHDKVRETIAKLVPALEPLKTIGATKREFHIPGRRLGGDGFPTPSGKAAFVAHGLPITPPLGVSEFILMTIRSEGQFNTVVYEDEDLYRGQERRDVVLMNPNDMAELGLREDDLVEVSSETGTIRLLARPFDIARKCAALYYPESNILVPRRSDPRSKTPAFKSVRATISRAPKSGPGS